jgi:hypothetical protein
MTLRAVERVQSVLTRLKIWGSHIGTMSTPYHHTPSTISADPEMSEKMGIVRAAIEREENKDTYFNPDVESAEAPERPFLLVHASVIGLAMTLAVFIEMLCVSRVSRNQHNYE